MPVIKTHTITIPAGGARVQASVAFDGQAGGSASDWGAGTNYRLVMTEYLADGVTYVTFEQTAAKPLSTTRARYADFFSSSYRLTAARKATVALEASASPGQTVTAWNVDFRIELIKR